MIEKSKFFGIDSRIDYRIELAGVTWFCSADIFSDVVNSVVLTSEASAEAIYKDAIQFLYGGNYTI